METTCSAVGSCRVLPEDDASQTSSELDPEALRAMLSELSGTELPPGAKWGGEAKRRLAQFQGSEGLPKTGMPDDKTIARLKVRYEQVVGARTESATVGSPSPEAHARVSHLVKEAVHAAENLAHQFAHDAPIRAAYLREAKAASEHVLALFEKGQLTEGEAAFMASNLRNQALASSRTGLSPAGKALSSFLETEGVKLPVLAERYALKMWGKSFSQLSEAERGAVCLKIAQKAGATNGSVTLGSRIAPHASRALLAVGIALAIYEVATAEDPMREAVKQGAGFAGFWLGAKAGGAIGAFACGPGAPVCATVGAIAGGILGALLLESAADRTYGAIQG